MIGALEGQAAIVTGGGRGIGRAIAEALASEGAAVTILARSKRELEEAAIAIRARGGRVLCLTGDVTNIESMAEAARSTEAAFGPVDLLVNNAGVLGPIGQSWEVDVEAWKRSFEVNVFGPFLAARAVLPGMVERRRGRIINISSGIANRPGDYQSAYAASKTAVTRFTESLALETKRYGIGVFGVSPGRVHTLMPETILHSEEAKKWIPQTVANLTTFISEDLPASFCLSIAKGDADLLSGRFLDIEDDLSELTREAERIERENLYTLAISRL